MKIYEKLILGFTSIAILVAVVGFFSFMLSDQIWGLRTVELPMEQNLKEIEVGLWQANFAANSYKLSRNSYYKVLFDEQVERVEKYLAEYEALTNTEIEKQYIEEFKTIWSDTKAAANKMTALVDKQKTAEDAMFVNVDEADDVIDFEIQGKWPADDPYLLEKEKAVREVEVSIWEAIHAAQQYTGLAGQIVRGEQKYIGTEREAAKRGAIASLVKGDFADLMERQFDDVTEYWTKYKAMPLADFEKESIAVFDDYWQKAVQAGRDVVITQKLAEETFNELFSLVEKARDIIELDMQAYVQNRIDNEDMKATNLKTHASVISIIAIIAAIIIGSLTSRSILRPISELTDAALQIKSGNLNIKMQKIAKDEIGELMVVFLEMADQLEETIITLEEEIAERIRKESQLEQTHRDLVNASHKAGMAQVASDILHNVGNVLNSINVSATIINQKLSRSELPKLEKVADMVQENIENLATYITEDVKGRYIPSYLTKVSKRLVNEHQEVLQRVNHLINDVDHVKSIIHMQQEYTKAGGMEVLTTIEEILEDAIRINLAGLGRNNIHLVRDFEESGEIYADKQKLIQVLVNLIGNAKHALEKNEPDNRNLTIHSYKTQEGTIKIEVADNGIGISKENLLNIFQHGFTTKKSGHGFGLHSGAIAAKEMGGSLTVDSEGEGLGAKFTLEIPFHQAAVATA